MKTTSTLLKYALLCLVAELPQSGYDLRKQFTSTPMRHFSASPGSIYPALYRLREAGLVSETGPKNDGGRRKLVFEISEAGFRELRDWLTQAITRSEVIDAVDELVLRFAFIDEIAGRDAALGFLEQFSVEIDCYIVELTRFYEARKPEMSLPGRLAFEHGIEAYEMRAKWAERAKNELIASKTFKDDGHGGVK